MYNLKLLLPEVSYTTQTKDQVSPQGVSQWLKHLNVSQDVEAQKKFLETLKKINRIHLKPLIRIKIMNLLGPAAHEIITNNLMEQDNTWISKNEKQKIQSDFIQHLLLETANAYKLILNEIVTNDTLMAQCLGKILPHVSYQVIHAFSCLLIERYSNYLSEPSYIWHELNQVYYMSEHLGLSEIPVHKKHSIEDNYILISILRIAGPYQLMQGEMRKLYTLIAPLTQHCKINTPSSSELNQYHLVDLAEKSAPGNILFTKKSPQLRSFDISQLNTDLKHTIKKITNSTSSGVSSIINRLDKEMLIRFHKQINFFGSQKEQRIHSDKQVNVTIGLSACHYILTGGKHFDPESEIKKAKKIKQIKPKKSISPKKSYLSENSTLSLVAIDEEDTSTNSERIDKLKKINPFMNEDMVAGDQWEQIYSSTLAQANIADQINTLDDLYREELWEEKNSSNGGMLLLRKNESSNAIHVGMLIAYEYKDSTEHLYPSKKIKKHNLGVIRWLRFNAKKGMALGVMKLSNDIEPVAVKATRGVGKDSDYNQALLIHKQIGEHESKKTLFVPSGIYDIGTVLDIWHTQKMNQIKITKKLMVTKTMMQVAFTVL